MKFFPRIIVPHPPKHTHTYSQHTGTHRKLLPGWLKPYGCSPGNCSSDDCPEDNSRLTISPWTKKQETVFRMFCPLHNCLSDDWRRAKLPPIKIVPRINYNRYIFSRRLRNRSILIDSCFFFFFFFLGCKLVPNYDFCIRKQFINTAWLKLLRNKEQFKDKMSVEQWNKFPHTLPTDRDWEGLPSKTS